MKRKLSYGFGALLLVAFAAFSAQSFNDSLTPYVPYDEARRAGERTVQVAGGLMAGSSRYDEIAHALHFTLTDPESGDALPVRYEGLKPANFEEAISIVAIGRYDAAGELFHADKLLVKCPSKYQGVEVQEYD